VRALEVSQLLSFSRYSPSSSFMPFHLILCCFYYSSLIYYNDTYLYRRRVQRMAFFHARIQATSNWLLIHKQTLPSINTNYSRMNTFQFFSCDFFTSFYFFTKSVCDMSTVSFYAFSLSLSLTHSFSYSFLPPL
jgi:hypothetical protein